MKVEYFENNLKYTQFTTIDMTLAAHYDNLFDCYLMANNVIWIFLLLVSNDCWLHF